MLLGPRPKPRRGPAEVAAAFQGSSSHFTWAPIARLSAGRAGLAYTVGEAVIVTNGKESKTKYLTIWRLESDGRWRYVFDIGSDRP